MSLSNQPKKEDVTTQTQYIVHGPTGKTIYQPTVGAPANTQTVKRTTTVYYQQPVQQTTTQPVQQTQTVTTQKTTAYNQQPAAATYQYPAVYQQPVQQRTVYQQPYQQTVSTSHSTTVVEKKRGGVLWLVLLLFVVLALLAFALMHFLGVFAPKSTELAAPTNLHVNQYTLSWNEVHNADGYIVEIDGGQFHGQYQTGRNGFSLSALSQGQYTVRVKAIGTGNRADSSWSSINYTARPRLGTPSNVGLAGSVLTWDSVANAGQYVIFVNGTLYHPTGTTFDLSELGLPAGTYLVKIMAVGGEGLLDSEWTEFYYTTGGYNFSVPAQVKLTDRVLTWQAVDGATSYNISINGQIYTSNTNSFDISFLNPSQSHTILIQAVIGSDTTPWTDSYIYSTASKMDTPANIVVQDGFLRWTHILNSAGYVVEVDGQWFETNSNSFSLFGQVSDIFSQTGNYTIRVFARGGNNADSDWSEAMTYTVSKLDTPSGLEIEGNMLHWTEVAGAKNYIVEINGVRHTVSTNSFNVSATPDLYNIRVMAMGNGWNLLDSNFSTSLNHTIIKLDKPTGLKITGKVLTWNPSPSAIEYLVDINGEQFTSNTNSFSLEQIVVPNVYTIKVKAIGNGDTILDSEWSDVGENGLFFTVSVKLPTPADLVITDGVLRWTSSGNNIPGYIVSVNGTQHNVEKNEFDLKGREVGTYTLRVMAKGNDVTYFPSDWSEPIEHVVKQLEAPENIVIGKISPMMLFTAFIPTLNWTPVPNATSYIVEINAQEFIVQTSSISLGGLTPGIYKIRIKAVGDGAEFRDSDWSGFITYEVFQLDAPANVRVSDTTLLWDDVPNASNGYEVTVNGTGYPMTATSFSLETLQPGIHYITVTAIGDNVVYYDSDKSEQIQYTVYRLDAPENITISGGVVTWNAVPNNIGYIVDLDGVENFVDTNRYVLPQLETNTYIIKVQALGNNVTHHSSMWSTAASYVVSRLNTPNPQISNTTLTWTNIGNAVKYLVNIDGTIYEKTTASFNLATLTNVRTYQITVQAIGNGTNYLDSTWSAPVTYTISKLATPTLTISGTTASWNTISGASGYTISVDGAEHSVSGTSFSLTSYNAVKTYNIRVLAKGNGTTVINSDWSATKTYTVVKLTAPKANISGKVVSWGQVANATNYTVMINNSAVTTVSTLSYTLTVTAVGTYNIQVRANGNGINYHNSDLSNTVVYKIGTPPRTDGCVVAGTLVTLADGSKKPIEQLTGNEMLLVWNFLTGTFDAAPIQFIKVSENEVNDMMLMKFSDGTTIKIARVHGLFNSTLNKFVYVTKDNADQFIGDWFNKQTEDISGNLAWTKVRLISVTHTTETVTVYNPVTFKHLSTYLNGILTMPADSEGITNIFEVDAHTMQYDMQKYYQDILTYGLFTYEELSEYMPQIMFDALGGQYFKIAIAKGLLDLEKLPEIFIHFAASLELHNPIVV